MARGDARAGDLAPIIEDIRTSGVTSLNAGGKATWSASQVNSPKDLL
jgi:pyruvate/oxaloacetate carboxyltransferase